MDLRSLGRLEGEILGRFLMQNLSAWNLCLFGIGKGLPFDRRR